MTSNVARTLAGAAALLLASTASRAQDAPRYRAPADTTWVETVNPYLMYWVAGKDTLGSPVHAQSVESQVWRAAGERLEIITRQARLDVARTVRTDTTLLRPDGTVALFNARPPGISTTLDGMLHLPATALAPGVEWADSVHADSAGLHGPRVYDVRRRLRVVRLVDSLGTRVAEIRAEGTVRYRDAFLVDSASGAYVWIDVTGPVEETFWFDVAGGRLLGRRWAMDLRGSGGIPDGRGGLDSVAAGLRSREWRRVVSSSRAHLLTRALPGRDSSLSVAPRPVLLHTVERSAGAVRSAMARNDGLVGTAETAFAGGRPTSYKAVWTDTAAAALVQRIRVDATALRVTRGDAREISIPLPREAWGIADYAMEEHLVPLLMALPADRAPHPIHIFRPTAGKWDHGTATIGHVDGFTLATLQLNGDSARSTLLITVDGDYLYAVNTGLKGSERVPAPGSDRRARLDGILARLRQPVRTSAAPDVPSQPRASSVRVMGPSPREITRSGDARRASFRQTGESPIAFVTRTRSRA